MNNCYDLIVIGGGAAGMCASIFAGQSGLSVCVLEKNKTFGKKLSLTGNGRCNYTNMNYDFNRYNSSDKERAVSVLKCFTPSDTIDFFRCAVGVEPYIKEGYVYPMSRSASEFNDAMIDAMRLNKVKAKANQNISSVTFDNVLGVFKVNVGDYSYLGHNVLIATGGLAMPSVGATDFGYSVARSFGHSVVPLSQALTGLLCDDARLTELHGVRVFGNVYFAGSSEYGEIQFTSDGISGIPVMQLSGGYSKISGTDTCRLDLAPDISEEELIKALSDRAKLLKGKVLSTFFDGMYLRKLAKVLLLSINTDINTDVSALSSQSISSLAHIIKNFEFKIKGLRSFEESQCTRGGVPLFECSEYLESDLQKGLYFAGEVLDVDGACGGYNLQWAWASAQRCVNGILIGRKNA